MKNYAILFAMLLFTAFLPNCHKSPVETQSPETGVGTFSTAGAADRDQDETVIETLGSASSLNITEDDLCSPARVKVVCLQHTCQSLRNNPIEFWYLQVRYYRVNSSGMVQYVSRVLTESTASLNTWYTLDDAIVKTSALVPLGKNNLLAAEVYDDEGVSGFKVAISDMYVYFDCNSTDGVVTQHKLSCNGHLRNLCQLYSDNPNTVTKTLVVADNCSNSSQGSASYTPAQEVYPCSSSL